MIDYATWCAIRDGNAKHLTARQIARDLGLNVKTVRRWRARPYEQRAAAARPSKLDPFKGRIVGWLEAHPLSAQQVFQRLGEAGYDGGMRIPRLSGHRFHGKLDTQSAGNWTLIPGQPGHLFQGKLDT